MLEQHFSLSALDIYEELKNLDLLQNAPLYWWPNAGTFEVVVSAILTQNTTWKNVEKSLAHLQGFLELDTFAKLSEEELKSKIKPSGFYNQKAPRLLTLTRNIQKEFQTFQQFQKEVTREWLLAQNGIGNESADAILCYACFRDEMVVDSYTKRLLKKYNIVFKKYEDYKEFLELPFRKKYEEDISLLFARFHGMIVEYNKHFKKELS